MTLRVFPSFQRRGGCAIKKSCEATFERADGVVTNVFDHPVRAYQRMPSAIFSDGASTPPLGGGEYSQCHGSPFIALIRPGHFQNVFGDITQNKVR